MNSTHLLKQDDRLREAPIERFAGQSHFFDLNRALSELRAEAFPAENGHRQKTIFHRVPVAKVLFAFDAGGALLKHSAHGLVTIHALEGRLIVQADEHDYELTAGQILILNPDVLHNVRASEASAMLLTVHMENEK
ncbi:MAG: cupin domain-containing protein [Abditibacteriaceae bacterium]